MIAGGIVQGPTSVVLHAGEYVLSAAAIRRQAERRGRK